MTTAQAAAIRAKGARRRQQMLTARIDARRAELATIRPQFSTAR